MKREKIFVNFSNHPSEKWGNNQREKALEIGNRIIDVPFPNVEPELSSNQVCELAEKYIKEILEMNPAVVMCQGEFTLCYYVINRLIAENIKVVAAVTKRDIEEIIFENRTEKKSVFKFVGFREYVN